MYGPTLVQTLRFGQFDEVQRPVVAVVVCHYSLWFVTIWMCSVIATALRVVFIVGNLKMTMKCCSRGFKRNTTDVALF